MSPRRGLAFLLGLGILASGSTRCRARRSPRSRPTARTRSPPPPTGSRRPSRDRARRCPARHGHDRRERRGPGSGVATVRLQRSPLPPRELDGHLHRRRGTLRLHARQHNAGRRPLRPARDRRRQGGQLGHSAVVANVLVDNTAPEGHARRPRRVPQGHADADGDRRRWHRRRHQLGAIQRSPADTTSGRTSAPTAAPYSCSLNTTTLANDAYDLRAVATDAPGTPRRATSLHQVDNLAPAVTVTNPARP